MNAVTPVMGIDFGTSNSKMAWYNPITEQAMPLKNEEGEDVTPSAVYYGEHETLVGKPAIDMLEDEQAWDRVILSVKRSMVEAPVYNLPDDRVVSPLEVAAEILRKLRRDAEEFHFQAEVKHAIVTCPASFDGLERDQIQKAAKMAGFSEVELLPEPVAAALAYTRTREKEGFQVGNYVLIYDLGGGTFDLAILVREGSVQFRLGLEPDGIKRCGGDDFDEMLYNYCDKLAQEKLGRPISLTGMRDLHFLYECRKRKEILTSHKHRTFSSYLAPDSKQFKYELDQTTFEDLIYNHVKKTVEKTKAVLEEAHALSYQIDTFVLVGGSAQVPLVKRLLDENLPLKALTWPYREVAVALGAAYHAYNKWNASPSGKLEGRQYIQYVEMAKTVWGESDTATKTEQAEIEQKRQTADLLAQSKPETFTLVHTLNGHANTVWCIAVNPNGQSLASGSEDGAIGVWNLQTGQMLHRLDGHKGGVYTVAICPDRQTLLSGGADGTIRMWNALSGAQLHIFTGQSGWPANATSLAVSPDGRIFASGSRDNSIKFWNLTTGVPLRPLVGHTDIVRSVAFSPNGQLLASGSADHTVKLWNLRTGMLIRNYYSQMGVQTVAFSPNGQLLVYGEGDKNIQFWSLRTGAQLRPIAGQSGMIHSVIFSPDGQFLASGSADGVIRLWNLRKGMQVGDLSGHSGGVQTVAFSLDGQTLASGSADATIKIWRRT
jgi:molecular chaperone DnaK (HSP70)